MKERFQPRLTIDIEGPRVTLGQLVDATTHFLELLRAVDREVTGAPQGALNWVVDNIQGGSVHLGAAPIPVTPEVPPDMAHAVVLAVANGLSEIQEGPKRPPFFSDAALRHAKDLSRVVGGGVTALAVRMGTQKIAVTQRIAAHVDELIGGKVASIGSVEGRLEMLSVHASPYFNVYEAISGRPVRCYFPPSLMDEVKLAFGKRVQVFGTIYSRRTGEPVDMRVEEIVAFPEEGDLPLPDDVEGILRNG